MQGGLQQLRQALGMAGKAGDAQGGHTFGHIGIIVRLAAIGHRQQADDRHPGAPELLQPPQHARLIAALVQIGDEEEQRAGRLFHQLPAIGQ